MSEQMDYRLPGYNRSAILVDSILPLSELMEHGREHAIHCGADREVEEDRSLLTDYAQAVARDTFLPSYDPKANLQDALRDADFQKTCEELELAKKAAAFARTNLGEREEERAERARNIQRATISQWFVFFAVAAITLSLSPSLHDRFFITIHDPLLAWFISGMGALVVAGMITWAEIGHANVDSGRTAVSRMALLVGIGTGLGFGIMRLSDAQNWREAVFAVALTVLEVSVVIALENAASGLRANAAVWAAYEDQIARVDALVRSAKDDLARREQCAETLNQVRIAHLAYVESRWVRANKVGDIEAAAVKAILAGYAHGIAQNKGRLLGFFKRAAV